MSLTLQTRQTNCFWTLRTFSSNGGHAEVSVLTVAEPSIKSFMSSRALFSNSNVTVLFAFTLLRNSVKLDKNIWISQLSTSSCYRKKNIRKKSDRNVADYYKKLPLVVPFPVSINSFWWDQDSVIHTLWNITVICIKMLRILVFVLCFCAFCFSCLSTEYMSIASSATHPHIHMACLYQYTQCVKLEL